MRSHLVSFKVTERSDSYIKNIEMYPHSAGENIQNRLFHLSIKIIVKYILNLVFFITYNKTKFLHIETQNFPYKLIKI